MPLSDWRDGFEHADAAEGWPAIYDRAYLQANIAGGEGFEWFYASAADRTAQVRTPHHGRRGQQAVGLPLQGSARLVVERALRPPGRGGEWDADRVGAAVQADLVHRVGLSRHRPGHQPAQRVLRPEVVRELHAAFLAGAGGTTAIQRAYLKATYLWWGDAANNPLSSVYGGRMVHVPECAAWTWDARPYPFFPALTDVWTDGGNWRLGHWLTGRLGAVSLAALVRHLCLRAGLPESRIDVTGLWGAVEGYAITALEKPARLDHHAVASLRL